MEEPEKIVEERTAEEEEWCAPLRCPDGNYRDFVGMKNAYGSLRRKVGEYDSSLDRHQNSTSTFEQSSSAIVADASVVPEDEDESNAAEITAEAEAMEDEFLQFEAADVIGVESNLPPIFPDVSLLSVSKLTEAFDQPSEDSVVVDVTSEQLNPGDL